MASRLQSQKTILNYEDQIAKLIPSSDKHSFDNTSANNKFTAKRLQYPLLAHTYNMQNTRYDNTSLLSYNNTHSVESNKHTIDNLIESDMEEIEIDNKDEIEVQNKIFKDLARCQVKEKKLKKAYMTLI
ncbi:hypothetical protein GLOIN_2v1770077 [Rhizophagus clarus]|uniref:Uncharacterized protein n=1 Tax=Rhizophagus clarus TaxID=94130 RepID=A0A8H3LM74_9GLOM|nr:hypothetical protein GLOIN_2v1770077 [Rhizophagus clarus]